MKKVWMGIVFFIGCFSFLFSLSCGGGGNNSDRIAFTVGAIESLPQVAATRNRLQTGRTNISSYNTLKEFFEQECFMPDSDNFCPDGIDTSGGDSNPYKFTPMTLLGLIYHAEMYSGGMKTSCGGTPATINASSFVAHTPLNSDPDKFLFNYYSLLGCIQPSSGNSENGVSYSAYSMDSAGAYQATLTTRYRAPYQGVAVPGQTDIFQVYVAMSGSTPTLLAFNFAGANTMYSRAVLLVNLLEHKFAVKYFAPGGTTKALSAVGVGGVDRSTGVPHDGYYYVRFTDNVGAEQTGCVSNRTGDFEGSTLLCSTNSVPVAWATGAAIQTYLGIADTDAGHLTAWLNETDGKLRNETLLNASDSPANATTDADSYFPETINSVR